MLQSVGSPCSIVVRRIRRLTAHDGGEKERSIVGMIRSSSLDFFPYHCKSLPRNAFYSMRRRRRKIGLKAPGRARRLASSSVAIYLSSPNSFFCRKLQSLYFDGGKLDEEGRHEEAGIKEGDGQGTRDGAGADDLGDVSIPN